MATLDALLATIHSDPPNAIEAAVSFFEQGPSALVLTGGGTVIEAMLRQAHTIGLLDPELAFALASTAACLTEYESFEATPQDEKDLLAAAAFTAMGAVCAHGFRHGSKEQSKHMSEAFTLSRQYFGGRYYKDSFVQGSATGLRHASRPSNVVSPALRFWRRSGCATGIAALLLMFYAMGVIKLPFKLPWEYDYEGRYATNPAYDHLGKDAKEYAAIVRAFNTKHRKEAVSLYNEYGRFQGVPEESRLWNINSDEAQRFLRANKNIYKAYEGGTLDEAKPGWLTLNQAEAIIRKEIPRPPHYQPAYGEPGYKRGEYVYIKEGIK